MSSLLYYIQVGGTVEDEIFGVSVRLPSSPGTAYRIVTELQIDVTTYTLRIVACNGREYLVDLRFEADKGVDVPRTIVLREDPLLDTVGQRRQEDVTVGEGHSSNR